MPSIEQMLRDSRLDGPPRPKLAPDIEAIRLADALDALEVRHKFARRMIVRQKKQAAMYVTYGDNDLAIVVAVSDEPIITGDDFAGPYFRSRLDMQVGSIEISKTGGGDRFFIYHVDSRRFEPVPAADLQPPATTREE